MTEGNQAPTWQILFEKSTAKRTRCICVEAVASDRDTSGHSVATHLSLNLSLRIQDIESQEGLRRRISLQFTQTSDDATSTQL